MPINLRFAICLDSSRLEQIVSILKGLGFEVSLAEISANQQQQSNSPNTDLVCKMTLGEDESIKALDIYNSIHHLEGVKDVIPMYKREQEKQPIRKHPVIPMIISATITFVTIYGVIQQLKTELTPSDIFNLAGIPTIVTFLSQALFKLSTR